MRTYLDLSRYHPKYITRMFNGEDAKTPYAMWKGFIRKRLKKTLSHNLIGDEGFFPLDDIDYYLSGVRLPERRNEFHFVLFKPVDVCVATWADPETIWRVNDKTDCAFGFFLWRHWRELNCSTFNWCGSKAPPPIKPPSYEAYASGNWLFNSNFFLDICMAFDVSYINFESQTTIAKGDFNSSGIPASTLLGLGKTWSET